MNEWKPFQNVKRFDFINTVFFFKNKWTIVTIISWFMVWLDMNRWYLFTSDLIAIYRLSLSTLHTRNKRLEHKHSLLESLLITSDLRILVNNDLSRARPRIYCRLKDLKRTTLISQCPYCVLNFDLGVYGQRKESLELISFSWLH